MLKAASVFITVLRSITRGHQRNECLPREELGVRMVSRKGTHGTGVVNDLGFLGQSALRRGISKMGAGTRKGHVSENGEVK